MRIESAELWHQLAVGAVCSFILQLRCGGTAAFIETVPLLRTYYNGYVHTRLGCEMVTIAFYNRCHNLKKGFDYQV